MTTLIACRTTDTRDDGPNHFMMGLPQEFAALLMRFADAHRAAKLAAETPVYCVEIFYSAGEWGNVVGLDLDRGVVPQWVQLPRAAKIKKPESVEFETVKVMEDGVVFSASWKNDDSGVYFETPVLPWRIIREVAQSGKPAADAFPEAAIDMEANADSGLRDLCEFCDHFVDENGEGQDREGYTDTQDRESYQVSDYIHLCDEVHHNPDDDHEAVPRGTPKTLDQWKVDRPDLFQKHEDGLIGPNSKFHVTKLDTKPAWEGTEPEEDDDGSDG